MLRFAAILCACLSLTECNYRQKPEGLEAEFAKLFKEQEIIQHLREVKAQVKAKLHI